MIHFLEISRDLVENPKTAQAIAGTTVASGTATWADWIPHDIGKIATLVGIVLSIVVIYTTLQRERRERLQANREKELADLQAQNLQLEIDRKRIVPMSRNAAGLPNRREDDEV